MKIERCEITQNLLPFQVGRWQGREFLFCDGKQIAQCINGDHDSRFGGVVGWIKHIEKRTTKRMSKINEQRERLDAESRELNALLIRCIGASAEGRQKT